MRQRETALPLDAPRSEQAPDASAPGPRFAHDFTRVPVQAADALENEADRAEDCACGGKCSSGASRHIQRTASGPGPGSANVQPILGGPSHPLDPHTRSFMEPYFGHDFSRVRVHSDPAAAASADSLGARAYTVGHHLVFGPGQYRPGTAEGRRLLAHELTHVMQQSAAGPMIQRADKEKKKKKKVRPELVVEMAAPDRQPARACLAFVHHSEANARRAAEAMHEHCRYNLAIVQPQGGRNIDIPHAGERDPNELFPRHVFRECHDDDEPCRAFIENEDNQKSKDPAIAEELVQRQFFVAIKECSEDFTLPVVALHTNKEKDTAGYREKRTKLEAKLAKTRKQLAKPDLKESKRTKLEQQQAELLEQQAELQSIRGKTFKDTPPVDGGTTPYSELETWLERNYPDLVDPRSETAKKEGQKTTWKKTIYSPSGGLLAAGATNIFKWCQAHDNSQCYIGDPARPDNVVWVTRQQDFDDIRAKAPAANVALQTRVMPGESETDLSSMFVGSLMMDTLDRMRREPTKAALAEAVEDVEKASRFPTARSLGAVLEQLRDFLDRYDKAEAGEKAVVAEREKVRYVNVETLQASKSDEATLAGYRDVRTILEALDLHDCDAEQDDAIEKKFGAQEETTE